MKNVFVLCIFYQELCPVHLSLIYTVEYKLILSLWNSCSYFYTLWKFSNNSKLVVAIIIALTKFLIKLTEIFWTYAFIFSCTTILQLGYVKKKTKFSYILSMYSLQIMILIWE